MRWDEFKEPESEIKSCQDALDKDPSDADAYYKLGTVYAYLSNFDKAMECCKKAVALKSKSITFLAFYSYLCTETEDHVEAIHTLIELIELGADESNYYVDVAQEAQCGMDKEYAMLKALSLRREEGKDSVADKLEEWLLTPFGLNFPQENKNEK